MEHLLIIYDKIQEMYFIKEITRGVGKNNLWQRYKLRVYSFDSETPID